jgi:hypothetical protein
VNASLRQIVKRAARSFGVKPALIFTRDRHERVALARKVAMVLAFELVPNMTAIGGMFGRDHGTVIHARRSVDQAMVECVRRGEPVKISLAAEAKRKPAASRKREHVCLCGNPATHWRIGWCCDRCATIERQLCKHESFAK